MPDTKKKRRVVTRYCDRCGRRLRHDHWIYSRWTHRRYCWAGEGCNR